MTHTYIHTHTQMNGRENLEKLKQKVIKARLLLIHVTMGEGWQ